MEHSSSLIAGLAAIIYLKFFGPGNYLGIHFGLWGLIVNFIVVLIGAAFVRGTGISKDSKRALKGFRF